MSGRLPEIQKRLDAIEAEARAALDELVRVDSSRRLRSVLEKGIVSGQLSCVLAIVQAAREALDE